MRGIFAAEREKQKRTKKIQRTVYLVGAGPGAGVTHTGILLAEFLEERRGARTLFLEINNHKDVRCIRRGLLSADYESLGEKGLEALELSTYDYIVADAGTDFSFWKEELPGSTSGLLVGSGAPWKRERFCQVAQGLQRAKPEIQWRGLLSLGNKKEALWLSERLQLPVEAMGWQPLYEPLSDRSEDLFLSLIQGGKK